MTKKSDFERVVFQPKTHQGMQRGINKIANAVRPTLGPISRIVAITKTKPHDQTPEMLDRGGIIARRVQQITDRDEDVGAMFIRQLIWRQHEYMGDGTATTAVLFQSIYNHALKFIAAGGNAMIMRRHMETGLRLILEQLESMTIPVEEREMIAQLAESVCFDPELSKVLGEIFDILGVYGQVDIRSGRSREIEREYVSGTIYGDSGYHAKLMINNIESLRPQLENPAIFLSDFEINDPDELVPVVRAAIEAGESGLVVVCRTISEEASGVLMSVSKDPQRFKALAVKTPGIGEINQSAFVEDLAVLTGGRALFQAGGETTQSFKMENFGHSRRVWADKEFFCVIGGSGDPIEIRKHVAMLKGRYEHVDEPDIRELTLTRLGKLMGGSSTLFVGGLSVIDIDAKKDMAEWAIGAVRGALLKGVLPGGGAALLACKPKIDQMVAQAESLDERVAYQVLSRALEEPTRTILTNAGQDPSVVLADLERVGPGFGFDVHQGEITDMAQAGIYDSAGVLLEAVRGAISSAALGITVDVIVHKERQINANRP
ncbi:MAG: TCP-1/cpn60 chaperonin family protein [Chloroflexota bacterium]